MIKCSLGLHWITQIGKNIFCASFGENSSFLIEKIRLHWKSDRIWKKSSILGNYLKSQSLRDFVGVFCVQPNKLLVLFPITCQSTCFSLMHKTKGFPYGLSHARFPYLPFFRRKYLRGTIFLLSSNHYYGSIHILYRNGGKPWFFK